jgi:hypothetical protein
VIVSVAPIGVMAEVIAKLSHLRGPSFALLSH